MEEMTNYQKAKAVLEEAEKAHEYNQKKGLGAVGQGYALLALVDAVNALDS